MRVLLNRTTDRFVRKARVQDVALCEAALAVLSGRWDADLGGGVYKQRIARAGGGKSGGFRVLLVVRVGDTVLFVLAFSKADRANISLGELHQLQKLSTWFRALSEDKLTSELAAGYLIEVICDGKTVPQ